jgi:hypothetical protein
MIELSVDVKDCDAHHEYGHEDVEKDAEFDQQGCVLYKTHAESVNAVLKDKIA